MNYINSNEVMELTGFSYRYIQMLLNNEIEKRTEIPHYKVVGKRIFRDEDWRSIPDEYCKSKVVYVREEVIEWFNENYTNK